MCGIAGFLHAGTTLAAEPRELVRSMSEAIRHRGPDDSAEWLDPDAGVALGFRRLAILDLTCEGRQPMVSASGRYVAVFNGQVYNHEPLRAELEGRGHRFRGRSDTEVMLAAFEEWGVAAALQRFNAMLACAVWDRAARLLHLIRDRVGKKPLYYGWMKGHFLFASELKPFHRHPAFTAELDRDALALYFRFGYVPAPLCIFRGIFKLPPATVLTIPSAAGLGQGTAQPEVYWPIAALPLQPREAAAGDAAEQRIDELETLLRDSVRLRMMADVPLGALLSGGIDSSTVVALMQAQSGRPIKTFTIGFHERAYDEAAAAKAVARHLGTEHCELYVTPRQCREVIPRLPLVYDEPFADSSQIPTLLVCELARGQVKVVLSGDGGDELFGGYSRYPRVGGLWRRLKKVPRSLRRLASGTIRRVPGGVWTNAARLLPPRLRPRRPADQARKLAEVLGAANPDALYLRWLSLWDDPAALMVDAGQPSAPWLADPSLERTVPDFTERMMYIDFVGYLPDDILVKVDRASMAASLEARAPLLDHRLVEWVWRLPVSFRLREGGGKWVLRRLLGRFVPPALTDRPKMGFGVPLDDWLREDLREWAESLLEENSLRQDGLLRPATVRAVWADHLAGRRDDQFRLWAVLMFQSWRRQWLR